MKNNVAKGKYGESLAKDYLISKGYVILDKNYRSKMGEIDIVAKKGETLVFIEVKARTTIDYGYPFESVNRRKQEKILKSSLLYIRQKKLFDYQLRYDIIEIYLAKEVKINHIENAFCQ